MRGWRLKECVEGGVEGGLVFFDGEQIVGSVLENENSGGFGLGVEGIEADHTPVDIEFVKEGAGDGDFVGLLGRHDRTAQIELSCGGNGGGDRVAASVSGFLAIDVDELEGIGFASDLTLDFEEDFSSSSDLTPAIRRQNVGCMGAEYLPLRRRMPKAPR